MKSLFVRLTVAVVAISLAAGCSSGPKPKAASSSPAASAAPSPGPTLSEYLSAQLSLDVAGHVTSATASDAGMTISTDLYLGDTSSVEICRAALGFIPSTPSAPAAASASASPTTSASDSPTPPFGGSPSGVTVYGRGAKLVAISNGTHCGLNLPIKAITALGSLCRTLNTQIRLDKKSSQLAKAQNISGTIAVTHQLLSLSPTYLKDATAFARSGLSPAAVDVRAMAAGNTEEWQGLLAGSRQRFNDGYNKYTHAVRALGRDGPPCN